MMVFSKHHPKKADMPSCLSDVSFPHLLSNIFPSLRHFTSSLQPWFKVSFTVNILSTLDALLKLGLNIFGMVTGHSLKQACYFSAHSSGVRADELGLLVPSYRSCLVNCSHFFFPVKQNLEKSLNCFYHQAANYLLLRGQVWSGQLRMNKNSSVFHDWDLEANIQIL